MTNPAVASSPLRGSQPDPCEARDQADRLVASFTPGPWKADNEIVGWWGGECPAVAVMFQSGPSTWSPVAHCKPANKTDFETIANARLIAAAPDMFEALRKARILLGCSRANVDSTMRPLYGDAEQDALLATMDAALAKARGEA